MQNNYKTQIALAKTNLLLTKLNIPVKNRYKIPISILYNIYMPPFCPQHMTSYLSLTLTVVAKLLYGKYVFVDMQTQFDWSKINLNLPGLGTSVLDLGEPLYDR